MDDFSVIENEVGIYFDYNRPVITNRVKSTLITAIDEDKDGYNFWEECNDKAININPGMEEIPKNEIDENCDGMDLITNINEIENQSVTIFPNPTNHLITIKFQSLLSVHITLSDITGKLIYQAFTNSELLQINLQDFPSSIYILKIYGPKGQTIKVQQIVKF